MPRRRSGLRSLSQSSKFMSVRLLARLVHSALTVVILGPALASARPPNTQRNYGLFGNVLASLVDVLRGRFSNLNGERHDDANRQGKSRRKRKKGKRKGYGPLGRLLVTFIGDSLGYSGGVASRGVSEQDADPLESSIVMPAVGIELSENAEDIPDKSLISTSRERLQGLRELLKILWSNFLPDPTFDRAVQRLLQRDACGLDMVSESEGLQSHRLLAWVRDDCGNLCIPATSHQ